jgi:predicted GNAT family acetyltransferase
MRWSLTHDAEAFAAGAWDLLAAEPAEQTVALTVVDAIRDGTRWADGSALFALCEDGGTVRGAALMTPPFELLLAAVPDDAVAGLAAALRDAGADVPGVNGDVDVVERFAAAWVAGTPLRARRTMEQRLYVLGTLEPPDPPPPGRARPAREDELALAAGFVRAFDAEAGAHGEEPDAFVRERHGGGRLWLWEDPTGAVVSMAARTPTAVGVARIAPVYTPPAQRRRGFGAAVTAACTADALARGADQVVLFTDLANPTSNAVYQRIGFRPLRDRRVVRFDA